MSVVLNSTPGLETKKKEITKRYEKRTKYGKSGVQLEFPPCNVCGKKASGIHYGVNTCEACKIFFRRYILRKEPYVCKSDGKCIENGKSSNCSACRMHKCLELGMSVDAIKKGRYTSTQRSKAIEEMTKRQKEAQKSNGSHDQTNTTLGSMTTPLVASSHNLSSSGSSPQYSGASPQSSGYGSPPYGSSFGTPPYSSASGSPPDLISSEPSPASSGIPPSPSDLLLFDNNSPLSDTLTTENEELLDDLLSNLDGLESVSSILSNMPNSPPQPNLDVPKEVKAKMNLFSCKDVLKKLLEENDCYPDMQPDIATLDKELIIDSVVAGYKAMKICVISMSDEEIKYRLQEGYNAYQEKRKLFGDLDFIPNDVYKELYEETKIDIDGRMEKMRDEKKGWKFIMSDVFAFKRAIPSFNTLSYDDQSALIKATFPDFMTLLNYRGFDIQLGMMLDYDGGSKHVKEIQPYFPQAITVEIARVTKEIQDLHLTKEEHALILAIYLTFQDKCHLNEPYKVEIIQNALTKTLQYLLQKTGSGLGKRKFYQIMDIFIKLRKIREDTLEAYLNMSKIRILTDNLPEMFACMDLLKDNK